MTVLCDGRAALPPDEPRQFMSYAGNYSFDGSTLVTRVDASSDASRIGGEQVRKVRFEDGRLVLNPPRRLWARHHAAARARLGARRLGHSHGAQRAAAHRADHQHRREPGATATRTCSRRPTAGTRAPQVIGITGPPGAGKSTLGRRPDGALGGGRRAHRHPRGRSVEPVFRRRGARRPHPSHPQCGLCQHLFPQPRLARPCRRPERDGGGPRRRARPVRVRPRRHRDRRGRASRRRDPRERGLHRGDDGAGARRRRAGIESGTDGDRRRVRRQQSGPGRAPTMPRA